MHEPHVHPLLLQGYGLVEAPFDRVVAGLVAVRRADESRAVLQELAPSAARTVDFLDRRTSVTTRLAIVEHRGWTAVVTNQRNGSDFNDEQGWASQAVGARTIRVVDSVARWWRRGSRRERLGYEARMFDLRGPDGVTVRSIACADDGGRWIFETSGAPLPVEATFAYDAARKKDRFTRRNLHELLRSLGAAPLTEEAFLAAPRFALIAVEIANAAWRARVEANACTLEEADNPAFGYYQRGLTWIPHMRTHASSVIADFERAVEIDPTYEPRVKDHLRDAYRSVKG